MLIQNNQFLQPLILVLKQFFLQFNHPDLEYKVSINTYTLTQMLVRFISTMPQQPTINFGYFLIQFFYYYGFCFNFKIFSVAMNFPVRQEVIQMDPSNFYLYKNLQSIHLFDDFNKNINLGKNINSDQLKKIFQIGYVILHTKYNCDNPFMPSQSNPAGSNDSMQTKKSCCILQRLFELPQKFFLKQNQGNFNKHFKIEIKNEEEIASKI